MKYRRVYRMLLKAGHSPKTAGEVILEAQRKSTKAFAMKWIRACKQHTRSLSNG